jgi:general stress protein 26
MQAAWTKAGARDRALAFITAARFVQAVTYPATGFPKARILGYSNDGWRIVFTTPRDTQKAQELAADPRISLLWFEA